MRVQNEATAVTCSKAFQALSSDPLILKAWKALLQGILDLLILKAIWNKGRVAKH